MNSRMTTSQTSFPTLAQVGQNIHHLDSADLAHRIVDVMDEKQATHIVVLDMRELTSVADYFVIATVDNERQAKAIQEELWEQIERANQIRPLGREGLDGSGWILIDYGDVIVHLFTEEARAYYDLETLWAEASVVYKML